MPIIAIATETDDNISIAADEDTLHHTDSQELDEDYQLPEVEYKLDILSVELPYNLPFFIVVPRIKGAGFIYSEEFTITNYSDAPVLVTLDNIFVTIANPDTFILVQDKSKIDDTESNFIFVSLICTEDGFSNEYILSSEAQIIHTYYLESEASVSFYLSGVVTQRDDILWDETTVTISFRYTTELLSDSNQTDSPEPQSNNQTYDDNSSSPEENNTSNDEPDKKPEEPYEPPTDESLEEPDSNNDVPDDFNDGNNPNSIDE